MSLVGYFLLMYANSALSVHNYNMGFYLLPETREVALITAVG